MLSLTQKDSKALTSVSQSTGQKAANRMGIVPLGLILLQAALAHGHGAMVNPLTRNAIDRSLPWSVRAPRQPCTCANTTAGSAGAHCGGHHSRAGAGSGHSLHHLAGPCPSEHLQCAHIGCLMCYEGQGGGQKSKEYIWLEEDGGGWVNSLSGLLVLSLFCHHD